MIILVIDKRLTKVNNICFEKKATDNKRMSVFLFLAEWWDYKYQMWKLAK